MEFSQIIESIDKKVFYPVYFLMGEEPYYIDEITNFIANNVLTNDEKEFNQTVVYGKDTNVETIVSYAKRFPMMANYQVVIVKEAQNLDKIENLQAYIESPLNSTILVICYKYGSVDKRKQFAKTIQKKSVLFESKSLYPNQIPDWVNSYVKGQGYRINPKATQLLADNIGNDLSRIANEIKKLIINLPNTNEISVDDIEKNIGISKDYNVFELQSALGKKQILKANRIVNYFIFNPKENPPQMVLPVLYGFFAKVLLYHTVKNKSDRKEVASTLSVNPFFVDDYKTAAQNYSVRKLSQIFFYLKEADMKSKGVDMPTKNDDAIYKELIYKILH